MKLTALFYILVLFTVASATGKPKMMPMKKPSLGELVGNTDKFDILVKLLTVTKLLSTVVSAKDITIFAPTDKAFATTAKDLGCKNTKTEDAVVKCLAGKLTTPQIATVLKYHVVPGVFNSRKVLKTTIFKTLEGKKIFRKKTMLVDLTAGAPNPKLIVGMLDIKYDNGIVHAIDRVLLPFINFFKADPCKLLEDPVVLVTGDFITIRQLFRSIYYCHGVYKAIKSCHSPSCKSGIGRFYITWKLTIGEAVAAVTTCKRAAMSVLKCPKY